MAIIKERKIIPPTSPVELNPELYKMSEDQLRELLDKMNKLNNRVDTYFKKHGWEIEK